MHNSGSFNAISKVILDNLKKPLEISTGNSNAKFQCHRLGAAWHAKTQPVSTEESQKVVIIKMEGRECYRVLITSPFFDFLDRFVASHKATFVSLTFCVSSNACLSQRECRLSSRAKVLSFPVSLPLVPSDVIFFIVQPLTKNADWDTSVPIHNLDNLRLGE
jgi:hypothetical protein